MEDYFPGVELPPHLSPFVEEQEGDYVPPERQAMLEEQRQTEAGESEAGQENEEGEEVVGIEWCCRPKYILDIQPLSSAGSLWFICWIFYLVNSSLIIQ